jgi:hypothetical protein
MAHNDLGLIRELDGRARLVDGLPANVAVISNAFLLVPLRISNLL